MANQIADIDIKIREVDNDIASLQESINMNKFKLIVYVTLFLVGITADIMLGNIILLEELQDLPNNILQIFMLFLSISFIMLIVILYGCYRYRQDIKKLAMKEIQRAILVSEKITV